MSSNKRTSNQRILTIGRIAGWIFITGSISSSATHRYLSYSEADFEVFRLRPAGATRCTDGVQR